MAWFVGLRASADGFYTYQGSDEPDESPDGRPVGNIFEANEITATKVGVKITDGDDNEFIGELKGKGKLAIAFAPRPGVFSKLGGNA